MSSSATAFGRENGAVLDALDMLTEGEPQPQDALNLTLTGGIDQYGILLSLVQTYGLSAKIIIENEAIGESQTLVVNIPQRADLPVHIG